MKNFYSLLVLSFLFLACSLDNELNNEEQTLPNDFALNVGNLWVYKNYKFDYNSNLYKDTGVIDSISIIQTEKISDTVYYKFRRLTTGNESSITFCNENGEHIYFLRESNGSLLDEKGNIVYSYSNFNEIQFSSNVYEKLQQNDTIISTEAGNFQCYYKTRYAKNLDGEVLLGLDHFYYSKGIGLIFDTSSFANNPNHTIERQLISYKLN